MGADDPSPVNVVARYEGEAEPAMAPEQIEGFAQRMLRALGLDAAELSILLCDDERIQQLNLSYRGLDQPTDVLAFAMLEGEPAPEVGPLVLGDVVISLSTATIQARARERSLVREVAELLAHGLLHLLGFDHVSRDEERRMVARTDLLIAASGAGVPVVENAPSVEAEAKNIENL